MQYFDAAISIFNFTDEVEKSEQAEWPEDLITGATRTRNSGYSYCA